MKRLLRCLLFPPAWVLCTLPPLVFALLIRSAVVGEPEGTALYSLYGLSAYALTLWAFAVPRFIRAVRRARAWVRSTRFGGRYMTDRVFRGTVRMGQGLTFNLIYVLFRTVSGIWYRSLWFLSLAGYYFLLALIRAYLLRGLSRRTGTLVYEYRCYRRTAWLLLPLNVAIAVMAAQTVLENAGFSYPGMIIYVSAAYTFYTVAHAVVNLVHYRRVGSPILSAGMAVSLIEALMSLFGLQTAMIAAFSGSSGVDQVFRFRMNAVTGGCVCLAVIGITVFMLLHARRGRRREGRT